MRRRGRTKRGQRRRRFGRGSDGRRRRRGRRLGTEQRSQQSYFRQQRTAEVGVKVERHLRRCVPRKGRSSVGWQIQLYVGMLQLEGAAVCAEKSCRLYCRPVVSVPMR